MMETVRNSFSGKVMFVAKKARIFFYNILSCLSEELSTTVILNVN